VRDHAAAGRRRIRGSHHHSCSTFHNTGVPELVHRDARVAWMAIFSDPEVDRDLARQMRIVA
jgi:hypothetical protein